MSIPLQLYEPPASAEPVTEAKGEQPAAAQPDLVRPVRLSRWQRALWWASLLVLLPVGLGVLQTLALLVQAERVRGALEAGLRTAELPKPNTRYVVLTTQAALDRLLGVGSPLEIHLNDDGQVYPTVPNMLLRYGTPFKPAPNIVQLPIKYGDTIVCSVRIPTEQLLPRWLGPLLPGVFPDETRVRWQVTVP